MKQSSIKNIRRCIAAVLAFCMVSALVNWEVLRGEAASQPHRHTFACYQNYWLACEYAEDSDREAQEKGHYHTEDCWEYDDTFDPVCQMEEGVTHTHNERRDGAGFVCKEVAKVLECDVPIHIHGPECIIYVPVEDNDVDNSEEPDVETPDASTGGDNSVDNTPSVEEPGDSSVPDSGDTSGDTSSDDEENNEVPDEGDSSEQPDVGDTGDVSEPSTPEVPDVPDSSVSDAETPDVPDAPEAGDNGDTSDTTVEVPEEDAPMAEGVTEDEVKDDTKYDIQYVCGMTQHEEHTAACFKDIYECRWVDNASAMASGISMSGSWNKPAGSGNLSISSDGMTAKWSTMSSEYFNYGVDFSLSTEANTTYAPGQMKIFIPVNLFELRDGTGLSFGNIQSMLANDTQFELEPETVWMDPRQLSSGTAVIALDDIDYDLGQDVEEMDVLNDWDDEVYERVLEVIEETEDEEVSNDTTEFTEEEQTAYEDSLNAVKEYDEAQEEEAGFFSLFNLVNPFAEKEIEYYVLTNSRNSVTGEKKFSLSGYLYKDLWKIIDGTTFDYTIYVVGEDTNGTPAAGSITFHGEVDTKLSSVEVRRLTAEDSIKRFYSWDNELSKFGVTTEQFEQDTKLVGNRPTYAYVRYQADMGIWGNKYVNGTVTLSPVKNGEIIGVKTSSGIVTDIGKDDYKWASQKGSWVSSPIPVGSWSKCYSTTVDVLVRYKVADVINASATDSISVGLTYKLDVADVDGKDNLSSFSDELTLTHNSSIIWRAYSGNIYGGSMYMGQYKDSNGKEIHNEWLGMLSTLAGGADVADTVHIESLYRALMRNGVDDSGYYVADPNNMVEVNLFLDKYYMLGLDNEVADIGVHDGKADYAIDSVNFAVYDGYSLMNEYGDAPLPNGVIPDNHKDMDVSIYVQTAANPNEWVLDGTVPLKNVWCSYMNYTVNSEDAIRVRISYPGAYGYCVIKADVKMHLCGSSDYMEALAKRVVDANVDNVEFVAWGGVIPVTKGRPSFAGSSAIGGTTAKQIIAYDKVSWAAWCKELGVSGVTDYTPYRMYDFTQATTAIMDIGLCTRLSARNAATGKWIIDEKDLGLQVLDRVAIDNIMSVDTGAHNQANAKTMVNSIAKDAKHPFNADEAVFFVLLPENMEYLGIRTNTSSGSYAFKSGNGSYNNSYYASNEVELYWFQDDFMGTGRTMVCYGAKDYRCVDKQYLVWCGEVIARPLTKDIYSGVQDTYVASVLLQDGEVVDFTNFSAASAHADNGSAMAHIDDSGLGYQLENVFFGLIDRIGKDGANVTPEADSRLSTIGNSLEVTTTGRPAGTELYITAKNNDPASGYQESATIYPTDNYEYRLMFVAAGQRQQIQHLGIVANIEDDEDGSHLANASDAQKQNNLKGTLSGLDLSGVPADKRVHLQVWGNSNRVDLAAYNEDPNSFNGTHLGGSAMNTAGWTRIDDYATRTDWSSFKSLYFYFDSAVFGSLDAEEVSIMTIRLLMQSPSDGNYELDVFEDIGYKAHCQAIYLDNLFGAADNMYSGSGSNIAEVVVSSSFGAKIEEKIGGVNWDHYYDDSVSCDSEHVIWATHDRQIYGSGEYYYRWEVTPSKEGRTSGVYVVGTPFKENGPVGTWTIDDYHFIKSHPAMPDPEAWILTVADGHTWEEAAAGVSENNYTEWSKLSFDEFVSTWNSVEGTPSQWVKLTSDVNVADAVAFAFDWGNTMFDATNKYSATFCFHGTAGSEFHTLDDTSHTSFSTIGGNTFYCSYRPFGFSNRFTLNKEVYARFEMVNLTNDLLIGRVDSKDEQGYIDPGEDTWQSIKNSARPEYSYYAEWGVTEPGKWTTNNVYANVNDYVSFVTDIPKLNRHNYVSKLITMGDGCASLNLVSIDTSITDGKVYGIYQVPDYLEDTTFDAVMHRVYQAWRFGAELDGLTLTVDGSDEVMTYIKEIDSSDIALSLRHDDAAYTLNLRGLWQVLEPGETFRGEESNFVRGSAARLSATISVTEHNAVDSYLYYVRNGCDELQVREVKAQVYVNNTTDVSLKKSVVVEDPDEIRSGVAVNDHFNHPMDFKYVLKAEMNNGKSAPVTDVVIHDNFLIDFTEETSSVSEEYSTFWGSYAYIKSIDVSYWEGLGIPVTVFGYLIDKSVTPRTSDLHERFFKTSFKYDLTTDLLVEDSGWVKLSAEDLENQEVLAQYGEFAFWFGLEEMAGQEGFNEIGSYWFDPNVGVRHPMMFAIDRDEPEAPEGIVVNMGMEFPESVYELGDPTFEVENTDKVRSILDWFRGSLLTNVASLAYTSHSNQHKLLSDATFSLPSTEAKVTKTVYHRDTLDTTVGNTAANLLVAANLKYQEAYAYRLTLDKVPNGATDVMVFDTVENSSILIANSMWADELGLEQTANESQFYGKIEGIDMSYYDKKGIPYTIFVSNMDVAKTYFIDGNVTSDGNVVGYMGETYPHAIGGLSPQDLLNDTEVWKSLSAERAKTYKGWADVRSFVVWFGTPEEGSYQYKQYGTANKDLVPLTGHIDVLMKADLDVLPPYGHTVRAINTAGMHFAWGGTSITYPVFTDKTQVSLVLEDNRPFSSSLLKSVRGIIDGNGGSWGSFLYADYWQDYDYKLSYTVNHGSAGITFMDSIEHIMGEEVSYTTGLEVGEPQVTFYDADGSIIDAAAGPITGKYSTSNSKNGKIALDFLITNNSSSVIDVSDIVLELGSHDPSMFGLNDYGYYSATGNIVSKIYPGETVLLEGSRIPCTAAMLNGGYSDVVAVTVPSLKLRSNTSESFTFRAEEVISKLDDITFQLIPVKGNHVYVGGFNGTAYIPIPVDPVPDPGLGDWDPDYSSPPEWPWYTQCETSEYVEVYPEFEQYIGYICNYLLGEGHIAPSSTLDDNRYMFKVSVNGVDSDGFYQPVGDYHYDIDQDGDFKKGIAVAAECAAYLRMYMERYIREMPEWCEDWNVSIVALATAKPRVFLRNADGGDKIYLSVTEQQLRSNQLFGAEKLHQFVDEYVNYGSPHDHGKYVNVLYSGGTTRNKMLIPSKVSDILDYVRDSLPVNISKDVTMYLSIEDASYTVRYIDRSGNTKHLIVDTPATVYEVMQAVGEGDCIDDVTEIHIFAGTTGLANNFTKHGDTWGIANLETVDASKASNLRVLPSNAFRGCSNLSNVLLPDSLVSIGSYSFYQCISLANINLSTVETFYPFAFANCNLSDIDLSSAVTIDSETFYENPLKSVLFGDNLSEVGTRAFYAKSATYKEVYLPRSSLSIKGNSFCAPYLTLVSIPKNVVSLRENSFMFYDGFIPADGLGRICYEGSFIDLRDKGFPGELVIKVNGVGSSPVGWYDGTGTYWMQEDSSYFNSKRYTPGLATAPFTLRNDARSATWSLSLDDVPSHSDVTTLDDTSLPMASNQAEEALVEQSGWHGTLKGIDVSDITSKGLTPIVYVSPLEVDDWAPVADSWAAFKGDFGYKDVDWVSDAYRNLVYNSVYNRVMSLPNEVFQQELADMWSWCDACAGSDVTDSNFASASECGEHDHTDDSVLYAHKKLHGNTGNVNITPPTYVDGIHSSCRLVGATPLTREQYIDCLVEEIVGQGLVETYALPDPMPDPGIYDYSYNSFEWYTQNAPAGFKYLDWETATAEDWAQVRSIIVHVADFNEDGYGFVNPFVMDSDGVKELSVTLHMQAPGHYDTSRFAYNQYFVLEHHSGGGDSEEVGDGEVLTNITWNDFVDGHWDEYSSEMCVGFVACNEELRTILRNEVFEINMDHTANSTSPLYRFMIIFNDVDTYCKVEGPLYDPVSCKTIVFNVGIIKGSMKFVAGGEDLAPGNPLWDSCDAWCQENLGATLVLEDDSAEEGSIYLGDALEAYWDYYVADCAKLLEESITPPEGTYVNILAHSDVRLSGGHVDWWYAYESDVLPGGPHAAVDPVSGVEKGFMLYPTNGNTLGLYWQGGDMSKYDNAQAFDGEYNAGVKFYAYLGIDTEVFDRFKAWVMNTYDLRVVEHSMQSLSNDIELTSFEAPMSSGRAGSSGTDVGVGHYASWDQKLARDFLLEIVTDYKKAVGISFYSEHTLASMDGNSVSVHWDTVPSGTDVTFRFTSEFGLAVVSSNVFPDEIYTNPNCPICGSGLTGEMSNVFQCDSAKAHLNAYSSYVNSLAPEEDIEEADTLWTVERAIEFIEWFSRKHHQFIGFECHVRIGPDSEHPDSARIGYDAGNMRGVDYIFTSNFGVSMMTPANSFPQEFIDDGTCPLCGDNLDYSTFSVFCRNESAHMDAYCDYFGLTQDAGEDDIIGTTGSGYSIVKSNVTTVALLENPNLPFAGGEGTTQYTIVGTVFVTTAIFFTAGAWLILKKKKQF